MLEAIQNVAKYANASAAKISLQGEGDALVFSVEDDGTGFDPNVTRRLAHRSLTEAPQQH